MNTYELSVTASTDTFDGMQRELPACIRARAGMRTQPRHMVTFNHAYACVHVCQHTLSLAPSHVRQHILVCPTKCLQGLRLTSMHSVQANGYNYFRVKCGKNEIAYFHRYDAGQQAIYRYVLLSLIVHHQHHQAMLEQTTNHKEGTVTMA